MVLSGSTEADTPLGRHRPLTDTLRTPPPEMTTEAGDRHPTGMHSCFHLIFLAVLGEIGQVIGPPPPHLSRSDES